MTRRTPVIQHRRYCLCGAALNVRSRPADLAAEFTWRHQGEGHGPATADQARRARQREEQRDPAGEG